MESLGIQQPTAGQSFPLGTAITIIAPMVISGGNWNVYLAVKKMEIALPPVIINVPGYKLELTPDVSVPTVAESMATNVFTPTSKGRYKIFAIAKGSGGLIIESVEIEVV